MLDGLESQSAGRICVMMTAMDVGSIPPALVRSGRIELWLETRLPDATARTAILQQHASDLPASFGVPDLESIAGATEGLTGADIKRLSEDARILFAFDRSYKRPLRHPTDYFQSAIETVRANKEKYAQAEASARQRHPSRPSFFDIMGGFMPTPDA
jgi:ATP-dependent 26S proteasome regulatory subunit